MYQPIFSLRYPSNPPQPSIPIDAYSPISTDANLPSPSPTVFLNINQQPSTIQFSNSVVDIQNENLNNFSTDFSYRKQFRTAENTYFPIWSSLNQTPGNQAISKKQKKLKIKFTEALSQADAQYIVEQSMKISEPPKAESLFQPFGNHEFLISKQSLSYDPSVVDDKRLLTLPVISVYNYSKTVQYVEYNNKQGVVSINLKEKMIGETNCAKTDLQSAMNLVSDTTITQSVVQLQSALKNISEIPTNELSLNQIQSKVFKSQSMSSKPCLTMAYCLKKGDNQSTNAFSLQSLHLNEKFLIYTKWSVDAFLIQSISSSIQEIFTAKNYQSFLTNTNQSIQNSIDQKQQNFEFTGELKLSDCCIREANLSVSSSFDHKSGVLLVSYFIEKVLSERKTDLPKKKNSGRSRLSTIDQQQTLSVFSEENSLSNEISSRERNDKERKPSLTVEQVTL